MKPCARRALYLVSMLGCMPRLGRLSAFAACAALLLTAAHTHADPAPGQRLSRPHGSVESIALKTASLEAAASAALTGPAGNVPPVVPFRTFTLEDPSGHAFDAFFASLRRAASKQGQSRVVFYGDSHTAPDLITGRLRQA